MLYSNTINEILFNQNTGVDNIYCVAHVGVGVASALEYKDEAWGGA